MLRTEFTHEKNKFWKDKSPLQWCKHMIFFRDFIYYIHPRFNIDGCVYLIYELWRCGWKIFFNTTGKTCSGTTTSFNSKMIFKLCHLISFKNHLFTLTAILIYFYFFNIMRRLNAILTKTCFFTELQEPVVG